MRYILCGLAANFENHLDLEISDTVIFKEIRNAKVLSDLKDHQIININEENKKVTDTSLTNV